MKRFVWLACVAAMAFVVYWGVLRDGCGTRGALPCPAAAIEEGVGVTIPAAQVCPRAGYLCAQGAGTRLYRWSLEKGVLRVRVDRPDFLAEDAGRKVRDAAVEGIMAWDRHPFPIVVDAKEYAVQLWALGKEIWVDIDVVWSESLFNHAAGLATREPKVEWFRNRICTWGSGQQEPPAGPRRPSSP